MRFRSQNNVLGVLTPKYQAARETTSPRRASQTSQRPLELFLLVGRWLNCTGHAATLLLWSIEISHTACLSKAKSTTISYISSALLFGGPGSRAHGKVQLLSIDSMTQPGAQARWVLKYFQEHNIVERTSYTIDNSQGIVLYLFST